MGDLLAQLSALLIKILGAHLAQLFSLHGPSPSVPRTSLLLTTYDPPVGTLRAPAALRPLPFRTGSALVESRRPIVPGALCPFPCGSRGAFWSTACREKYESRLFRRA